MVKKEFEYSLYLDLPQFETRQIITKMRCSDHVLEIEKGRHHKISRDKRICRACHEGAIEDEEHFLLKCRAYRRLREKYEMNPDNIDDLLNTEDQEKLARYLISAFKLRDGLARRTD